MLLAAALGAGAVSLWRGGATGPPRPAAQAADTAGASLARRVATLEASLGREREQREALAAELDGLKTRLARITAPAREDAAAAASAAAGPGETAAVPPPRAAARGADRERRRIEALVTGGFTQQRAEWIEQQADRLRMQVLEARYAAARAGKPFDRQAATDVKTLHDVLGDDEYAQYLSALGRPTSISVRNVLPSSPAQQAGLKPGDQVVGYAGQRVFDAGELNRLTLAGTPGQQVEVDVIRDGAPMQLYVPRGPLGITGGWFRGRP
jgi:hypothetical protein